MNRGHKVRHLCIICVLGPEAAQEILTPVRHNLEIERLFPTGRDVFVPPRVELIDFTPHLLQELRSDPSLLAQLSSSGFEDLVGNRLERMGFNVTRVGSHTFPKRWWN